MTQENKKPSGPADTRSVADTDTNVRGGPPASYSRLAELATLTETRRNGPPCRRPIAHKKIFQFRNCAAGLGRDGCGGDLNCGIGTQSKLAIRPDTPKQTAAPFQLEVMP